MGRYPERGEIRNPKNKRYAYEWFMRAEDARYWKMTKEFVKKEKEKLLKITAVLTAISTAVTVAIISFLLHRFQKQ